jgi:hypothetical protein
VLRAWPSQRAVRPGSAVRYRISVRRRGFRKTIALSVDRAPRSVRPRLSDAGSIRTLTVATRRGIRRGRYRLIVRARGGRYRTAIRLLLTVRTPTAVGIAIAGNVTGLAPGVRRPINLRLRDLTSLKLRVTRLSVAAKRISAPRATSALPCPLSDFSIRQYSGSYPLAVPARTKLWLSSLRVPQAKWPQVTLINRPHNQDGCQGAKVTLTYTGWGTTR